MLTRTGEDSVGMKDLDQLQQDFENLLSTCAMRYRLLKVELDALDKTEERKDKRVLFAKTFNPKPLRVIILYCSHI